MAHVQEDLSFEQLQTDPRFVELIARHIMARMYEDQMEQEEQQEQDLAEAERAAEAHAHRKKAQKKTNAQKQTMILSEVDAAGGGRTENVQTFLTQQPSQPPQPPLHHHKQQQQQQQRGHTFNGRIVSVDRSPGGGKDSGSGGRSGMGQHGGLDFSMPENLKDPTDKEATPSAALSDLAARLKSLTSNYQEKNQHSYSILQSVGKCAFFTKFELAVSQEYSCFHNRS